MQMQQATTEVSSSGIQQTKAFSMKASAKAFRVVIDGLYSNKIGAVVREICTNAFDAHMMVNKQDQPFDVQLPTVLDPTFGVRDYGPGLSHEATMNLYVTIFESDKAESNDLVGGFGLGSKSPFAVTDQFIVISRFEGMKRTYSCYIASDGTPCISLLSEEASSEASGLEVRVPVKSGERHRYNDECRRQLEFFNPRPNFSDVVKFPERDIAVKGPGFEVHKTQYESGGYWQIVQGVVAYPLTRHELESGLPAYAVTMMTHARGVIHVPIGSVEVAASREGLSYTDKTLAFLCDRMKVIARTYIANIQQQINAATSHWEAIQLCKRAHDATPYQMKELLKQLTYKGQKIEPKFPLGDVGVIDHNWHKIKNKRMPDRSVSYVFEKLEPILVFIDDDPQRKVARFEAWFDDNPNCVALVIDEGQKHNFPEGYPEDYFVLLSGIEPAPPQKRRQSQVYRQLRWVKRYPHKLSDFKGPIAVDNYTSPVSSNPTDGYYVVTENNTTAGYLGEAIFDRHILPGDVYLVQKSAEHLLKELPELKPFLPAFKEAVKAAEKAGDIINRNKRLTAYNELEYEVRNALSTIDLDPASIRAVKPFWKFYKAVHEFRVKGLSSEDHEVLKFHNRYFPSETALSDEKYHKKVEQAFKKFEASAPLLLKVMKALRGNDVTLDLINRLS